MIDRYTKAMLSVIAAALVAIVLQHTIAPSTAETGVQRVVICSAKDTTVCATVQKAGYDNQGFLFVAPSK